MSLIMSGWCAAPSPGSHERCQAMGAGSRANPRREFYPCPCACHLGETYECEGCGGELAETVNFTGDGEEVYVHLTKTGRVAESGEYCP